MRNRRRRNRHSDSGTSLFLVAGAMVVLLAVSGLAIDLVSLYAARSEAQRTADAAALAGAAVFATSGCTGGASGVSCTGSAVEAAAASQAASIGNQNLVAGQNPNIAGTISAGCPPTSSSDVCFTVDASNTNPRITVLAQRTAAHGNAMPLFFMKIFGKSTADISAVATAEAYNPSGAGAGSPTICESCLKPVIVPNCDPLHASPPAGGNTVCPAGGGVGAQGYFIDPTTHTIANPGVYPAGAIGETWTIHTQAAPSQYYELDFGGGGAQYATNIRSCNASNMTCGDQYATLDGNKVGPTTQAWSDLIHQTNSCKDSGQDTITVDSSKTPPYVITGGSNNPNPALRGVVGISSSDSIVTVPVYDGTPLNPGKNDATIVGFMQVFITKACHSGTSDDVTSVILNVTGCANDPGGCASGGGGGGSGGSGRVSGGGASTIPVRLVSN